MRQHKRNHWSKILQDGIMTSAGVFLSQFTRIIACPQPSHTFSLHSYSRFVEEQQWLLGSVSVQLVTTQLAQVFLIMTFQHLQILKRYNIVGIFISFKNTDAFESWFCRCFPKIWSPLSVVLYLFYYFALEIPIQAKWSVFTMQNLPCILGYPWNHLPYQFKAR